MNLNRRKAELRHQFRATLRALSCEALAQASALICAQLQSWPVFQKVRVMALFYPTAVEPNVLPLLRIPDKAFLFPRCHPDKSLTWHPPTGIGQWKRSPSGIIEPDPMLSPARSHDNVELVLVPGLAFTPSGVRLGQGGGYYDRFLSQLGPQIPTAGLCFSCQVHAHLPTEAHDVVIQHVFQA